MPRKKDEDAETQDSPKRRTTMNVDPTLLRKAKHVAMGRDIELQDYIDSILRPVVERDYQKFIQDEAKQ